MGKGGGTVSQLTDSLNAVMGGVQKAMLIIHKDDAEDIDTNQVVKRTEQVLNMVTSGTDALGNAVDTSLSGISSTFQRANLDVSVMQVQYNPSSLSIMANAQPIPFSYLQQNVDSGIPNQMIRPPMVVLSVELLFDATNPQDAFMMDKFRVASSSVVSDISGGIKAKQGGYTVQPQTEALMAMILRGKTRVVTFRWADMAFTGQVSEVRADYTMFSVSGKPIRSRVMLNINQQVESNADLKYWDKALDKTFEKGNTVETKKAGQQLGSLLNLDAFK
jgi:hypothetical protein